jgi:hypothetical protein
MNARTVTIPMIILLALATIPWLGTVSANAADQPSGVASTQETKQVFTETQRTTQPEVPAVGVPPAQVAWIGEMEDSLRRYKASYPASNFDPYTARLATVKRAVSNGQKEVVRAEMGAWLKMLRTRANGISDIAADELFNYSVLVVPIAQYRISVPPPVEYGMPSISQQ